jgi:chromosome segregation ATPase
MKFLIKISLCVIMLITTNQTSFTESKIELLGPTANDFKAHVALNEKGIVISSDNGLHDENLLRLVAEKLESDNYLIDYRLFRNCEMKIALTGENKMRVNFSPKSLENRSKNEKFDINLDVLNYRSVLPANVVNEVDIKGYLQGQCQNRKNEILKIKNNFRKIIEEYKTRSNRLSDISKNVFSKNQEVENVTSAIADAEKQITDISKLKDSYQMQLVSIDSLTQGANRLVVKENERTAELQSQQTDLVKRIEETQKDILAREESLTKIKENNRKAIERSKDVESAMISYQKELSEVDGNLSNIRSSKLGFEYDLKNARMQSDQVEKDLSSLINEVQRLEGVSRENNEKSEIALKDKNDIESLIQKDRSDIKSIEEQINNLILEKSKKEESLKNKFDRLKSKDEELVNLHLENDQILSKIKRLSNNKEKVETAERVEIQNRIEKINENIIKSQKSEAELASKQLNLKKGFDEKNQTKENLQLILNKNNKDIDKINKEILGINNKRIELEHTLSQTMSDIRVKSNKLKNLRTESTNYDSEKNSIKRSLSIADENLETFKGILNEFSTKLMPLQKDYEAINTEKCGLEKEMKDFNSEIKSLASGLRKETPSAAVMIDLAEDEAFNTDTKSIKWKVLIDKIIS